MTIVDMRLDPQGLPSWRYRLRTRAWCWLVAGIRGGAKSVPAVDYDAAREKVDEQLAALREQAEFTPPDYRRIKHK